MAAPNTSPANQAATTVSEGLSTLFIPNVLGPIVDIELHDSKIVQVHKDVLERSPFFKNALKPEWAEKRRGKPIDLSEEHVEIFASYVSWLYSHNIEIEIKSSEWAHMYVLGENLMDLEFQTDVLTTLIRFCIRVKKFPVGGQLNIIYDGTTKSSPARRLLVDFFCWGGEEEWFDKFHVMKDPPAQFLTDLAKALMRLRKPVPKDERPWVKNPDSYLLQKRENDMEIEG